jgi:hypothetical protein
MSKYPSLMEFIGFIHYFLMYYNIQYKVMLIDVSDKEKENSYITYEPGRRLLYKDITLNDEQNINIICDDNIKSIYLESIFSKIDILKIVFFIIILIVIITTIFLHIWKFKTPINFLHLFSFKTPK